METILTYLQCIAPYVSKTTLKQMGVMVQAIVTMTGRVTMLGISRWTEEGGSYRTVQRFFHEAMPWALMFVLFFRQHLHDPEDVYILAGDETVVTKAGKHTHGLDRFFSSLYGKAVPGLAFFGLSLVSTKKRRSYPIMLEQVLRSEEEKAAAKAKKKAKASKSSKAKAGRPKGSKNKDKTKVKFTPELRMIKTMVQKLLLLLNGLMSISYLVMDGHFGNNNALQMTRQCALHLISKLRHDAALHFLYDGPQSKAGRNRVYGDKIDYHNIPLQYLIDSTVEDGIQTDTYQMTMLHRDFAQMLNVIVIVKTNLKTRARAHVVLFSSDLDLAGESLLDYYRLRFQIEFNFRDAKQFWGLEDFMVTSQTAVTNAANLALFMVNVSQLLLRDFRLSGVLDLKAHFLGRKYVSETFKLLPEIPDPILMAQVFDKVSSLGCIHSTELCLNSS